MTHTFWMLPTSQCTNEVLTWLSTFVTDFNVTDPETIDITTAAGQTKTLVVKAGTVTFTTVDPRHETMLKLRFSDKISNLGGKTWA